MYVITAVQFLSFFHVQTRFVNGSVPNNDLKQNATAALGKYGIERKWEEFSLAVIGLSTRSCLFWLRSGFCAGSVWYSCLNMEAVENSKLLYFKRT